jgi:hypothetical protein
MTNDLVSLNFLKKFKSISSFFHLAQNLHNTGLTQSNTTMWEALYRNYYMGQLLLTPAYTTSINVQEVIPTPLLDYFLYSVKALRWKSYYIKHGNEILELLFLSLWFKNLTLFMKWMRKYFEKINLKKHKKLFLLLKFLIGKFIWNFNLYLNIKGARIALRGKFAKAGSVRKVRKYIKYGKCSYTAKQLASINETNIIRTTTGTFSIKMEIFFKKWWLHLAFYTYFFIF